MERNRTGWAGGLCQFPIAFAMNSRWPALPAPRPPSGGTKRRQARLARAPEGAGSGALPGFARVDVIGIARPRTVNHPYRPQRRLLEIERVRKRVCLGVVHR